MPLPKNVIEFNFDDASKRNPEKYRPRTIVKDHTSKIIIALSKDKNTIVQANSFLIGLKMAIKTKTTSLQIKRDSMVIINCLS